MKKRKLVYNIGKILHLNDKSLSKKTRCILYFYFNHAEIIDVTDLQDVIENEPIPGYACLELTRIVILCQQNKAEFLITN